MTKLQCTGCGKPASWTDSESDLQVYLYCDACAEVIITRERQDCRDRRDGKINPLASIERALNRL